MYLRSVVVGLYAIGQIRSRKRPSGHQWQAVAAHSFTGAGVDPPLAIILAESTHTLDAPDGHTFTIHTEFPAGAEATVTFHLFANTTRSPDEPPVITSASPDAQGERRGRVKIIAGRMPIRPATNVRVAETRTLVAKPGTSVAE